MTALALATTAQSELPLRKERTCSHLLAVGLLVMLQRQAFDRNVCSAGQRGTVLFAGSAGMVVLVAVPLSLFARLSLAVLTVGNVLFWKACMPTKGQTRLKVQPV